MAPNTADVTMIGLGPMGQAMTRALLDRGHRVTVWNRTAARADGVCADGARWADTPAEAVRAADLVILSLTDYDAMDTVLAGTETDLAGHTLLNLSSDTPERTREAAAWAQRHGAAFLTGGVMVPAPMLGTEAAYVYYSGDRGVFDRHRETVAAIGAPRYLGEDPGLAQLMYQAQLDLFLTALAGLMHATALVGSAGLRAEAFLPEALELVGQIPAMLDSAEEPLGAQIDDGRHPGDLSTATMMGATADHILATTRRAGLDARLPAAVQHYYERVRGDGHGSDNWTRIIDAIRAPRP